MGLPPYPGRGTGGGAAAPGEGVETELLTEASTPSAPHPAVLDDVLEVDGRGLLDGEVQALGRDELRGWRGGGAAARASSCCAARNGDDNT